MKGILFPILAALLLAACDATLPTRPTTERPERVTASMSKELSNPAPANQERQFVATLESENSLFFDPDSSDLDARGRVVLNAQAQRLLANPRLLVTLTGHSDDQGSHGYNLALAEQRINVVYQALRELGVSPRQMRRYAVGQGKAPAACRTPACRRAMRRVDFVYPERDELTAHRIVVDDENRNERQEASK